MMMMMMLIVVKQIFLVKQLLVGILQFTIVMTIIIIGDILPMISITPTLLKQSVRSPAAWSLPRWFKRQTTSSMSRHLWV